MRRFVGVVFLLTLGACAVFAPKAQRYVVFFQQWSAALDNGGVQAVSAAATAAQQFPDRPIVISGFADPEGSPQANIDISRARAQMVSDALVKQGVSAARIRRQAIGEVNYALDSQESRRVEIYVGAP